MHVIYEKNGDTSGVPPAPEPERQSAGLDSRARLQERNPQSGQELTGKVTATRPIPGPPARPPWRAARRSGTIRREKSPSPVRSRREWHGCWRSEEHTSELQSLTNL